MNDTSGTRFQTWFAAEIEWTKALRRRKRAVFWKCVGITILVALLVGLIGYCLNASSDDDIGVIVVAAVIFSTVLITVLLLLTMLPGFLKGSYRRKIRRAMKRLGFSEIQQEQFAKEQLAVQSDPSCTTTLDMAGFGQDHMPARFTLSEHYACLVGGMDYGPYIVGLDGTEAVQVRCYPMSIPMFARVLGVSVSKKSTYVTYLIQFMGQGTERGRIVLSDRESCDRVLDVLRPRFSIAAG